MVRIEIIEDELKDGDEILADQNEINEDTRAQLDAISTALAEWQSKEPREKPRRKIGFVQEGKWIEKNDELNEI